MAPSWHDFKIVTGTLCKKWNLSENKLSRQWKTKVLISLSGRTADMHLYYIFEAILILFLVIFEDDKNDNFLRGDKSFWTLKRTKSHQNRVNDVTSKHLLCHFRTSKKVKRAFYKCNLLIYLPFVKNTRNISLETCKSCKQTHVCALVCLPDLQVSWEIFPVFLIKGGLISISFHLHKSYQAPLLAITHTAFLSDF